jgi:membrane protein YqaA with SNARE-associated domain
VTQSLLGTLGLYGATVVVCFLAGLIPFINAEVFLVGVSLWAVSSPSQLPAIVALAATGQMLAKIVLYYAGLGVFELPRGRWREQIERARTKLDSWGRRRYLVYGTSSTLGLPPFYVVSLAAGALRIGLGPFIVIGLLGRAARFSVIVAIPWL